MNRGISLFSASIGSCRMRINLPTLVRRRCITGVARSVVASQWRAGPGLIRVASVLLTSNDLTVLIWDNDGVYLCC